MEYPKLKPVATLQQTVEAFGGYNAGLRIAEHEFSAMENMTSDHYPVLSPRGPRGRYTPQPEDPRAMVSNQGLCVVDGQRLLLPDGSALELGLTPGDKQLVSMGAFVIILPDKKWVNVAACLEAAPAEQCWGEMEASWSKAQAQWVSFDICKADGTVLDNAQIPVEKPAAPADGQLWCDRSGVPAALMRWSEDLGLWQREEQVCLKIAGAGLGALFSEGDSVRITGVEYTSGNDGAGDRLVDGIPDYAPVIAVGESYIVVPGFTVRSFSAEIGEMEISRRTPQMDHVVECGNRLWGCKYGLTEDGFVNEIYCCKLGDFKNWHSFRGISTDSYAVTVGADGPFTGAASFRGRPVFFKENCILELLGSRPENYQLRHTACEGVQAGSHRSLATVNNILYYRSPTGVCAYDGTMPEPVGRALGRTGYGNAAGGGWGEKYYLSMQDRAGEWSVFVLDTQRLLWHREDSLRVSQFCSHRNELYCLVPGQGILTAGGSGEQAEACVSWWVETGCLGLSLPQQKYISRLLLRLQLQLGARVSLYARYDRRDSWEHLYTAGPTHLRSFTLPIRPRRCDYVQLRLEGEGEAKLYSLTKIIERGSEMG